MVMVMVMVIVTVMVTVTVRATRFKTAFGPDSSRLPAPK
jgi:hypothetical protein